MSKAKLFWTGLLSFIPLIAFMVLIVMTLFYMSDIMTLAAQSGNSSEPPKEILEWAMSFIIVSLVFSVAIIGILIYFIYDVFHNKHVPENRKVAWLLVVLLASVVGFPIYWFMNIYKYRNEPEVA